MKQGILSISDPDRNSIRRKLPDSPGAYLFKNRTGKVIYVGKAKSLKKRVLSYFKQLSGLASKTALMMARAKGLDYIMTSTEKEAFILENSLIKKHKPRYNIVLRDDSQYPSLRLGIKEPYPALKIVRKIKKDGALYFGPFSSAQAVRSTLRLINRIFHLRKCGKKDVPERSRPCLNFQLDRCPGLCTHDVSPIAYNEVVEQVRMFLEGRNSELINRLRKKMSMASDQLDFETAARIRDQIMAVEKVIERQNVVSSKLEDQDVVGLYGEKDRFILVVLHIRKGYLSGSRNYLLNAEEDRKSEVMEAFLKQYYSRETFIPKYIIISESVHDLKFLNEWLSDRAGERVYINRPLKGEKLRLTDMAVSNAKNLLKNRDELKTEDLLEQVKSVFGLDSVPRHIEGIDISNLHGEMAVGATVAFKDGLPDKTGYRNYRIKEVEGIDDYGMMAEMVLRRLQRNHPPDLFLVDGGKGHLAVVKRVVDKHAGEKAPYVVAIAKGNEREDADKIFIPGRKNPLSLKGGHPVLHFMMRIRDEAHRRAISYHKKLRSKKLKTSDLDSVPGIGKKRKTALLKEFGSVSAISQATAEELAHTPGMTIAASQNIVNFFLR